MPSEIEVVVHCPLCGKVYRQTTAHHWQGKTRVVKREETALRALCVEARQGTEYKPWTGVAYCTECSLAKVPDVLRSTMERWLREGERPCGS